MTDTPYCVRLKLPAAIRPLLLPLGWPGPSQTFLSLFLDVSRSALTSLSPSLHAPSRFLAESLLVVCPLCSAVDCLFFPFSRCDSFFVFLARVLLSRRRFRIL